MESDMKPCILIVEDDALQSLLYWDELEEEGYEVLAVSRGKDALALADQRSFDLVLLDLHLPGEDGIATMRSLQESHPRLPIIIHTAYGTYRNHSLAGGAQEYVVKSSDLTELKAAIRRLVKPADG